MRKLLCALVVTLVLGFGQAVVLPGSGLLALLDEAGNLVGIGQITDGFLELEMLTSFSGPGDFHAVDEEGHHLHLEVIVGPDGKLGFPALGADMAELMTMEGYSYIIYFSADLAIPRVGGLFGDFAGLSETASSVDDVIAGIAEALESGTLPGVDDLPGLDGLPGLDELPGLDGLPEPGELPGVPELGELPGIPDLGEVPALPDLGELPGVPDLGELPGVPGGGEDVIGGVTDIVDGVVGDGGLPEIPGDGALPEVPGDGGLPEVPGDGGLPEVPGDGLPDLGGEEGPGSVVDDVVETVTGVVDGVVGGGDVPELPGGDVPELGGVEDVVDTVTETVDGVVGGDDVPELPSGEEDPTGVVDEVIEGVGGLVGGLGGGE